MKHAALLYEKTGNKTVHCFLCNHHCRIAEQEFGFCGVRQNLEGELFTLTYADVIAAHVDPIEKKPLCHFLPGSSSFSIATIGCNFHCGFCQNWQISQQSFRNNGHSIGEKLMPDDVVKLALEYKCKSISYTYTEPTIFFEYALDIMKLARSKGLYNSFVTNGYMTPECLEMARPYLDAANVDLKFFKEESYKRVCLAKLQPVLESIKLMNKLGIWTEVTTLVIPGENDSEGELKAIAEFLSGIDKNIPWHISGFHPEYKFIDHQATPEPILYKAQESGKKAGLRYVYVGNVYGSDENTYCPECKKPVIVREGFNVLENNLKHGKCIYCKESIAGVFE